MSSPQHHIASSQPTLPGVPEEKIRWWNDVIPSKAPLLKYGWKCSAQSYCRTCTVPSSDSETEVIIPYMH